MDIGMTEFHVPHLDVVTDVVPEVPPRDYRQRDAPQAEHHERENEYGSPASDASDPGFQPADRVAQAGTCRHLGVAQTAVDLFASVIFIRPTGRR